MESGRARNKPRQSGPRAHTSTIAIGGLSVCRAFKHRARARLPVHKRYGVPLVRDTKNRASFMSLLCNYLDPF